MDGKKVKRLDRTVSALLCLTRDRLFDQIICKEREKITSQIGAVRSRHQNALNLDVTVVSIGEVWLMSSQSTEDIYLMQKTETDECSCKVLFEKA